MGHEPKPEIPEGLLETIIGGRCVAFVGAGFSYPTVPDWQELLRRLTDRIEDAQIRSELGGWLRDRRPTNRDLEGIAQAVEAALGGSFDRALREVVDAGLDESTRRRRCLLRGIPFHYVLTTNFDPILGDGALPAAETYGSVIGAPRRRWWSDEYWGDEMLMDAERPLWAGRLVQLHGKVTAPDSVVFTARRYRELVHGHPGYRSFLRTLMATRNILYLGFSFTDAYVNELRSEILATVGLAGGADARRDYAILGDVSEVAARHLSDHDGLEALTFDTARDGYAGFDRWLEAIHDATNPYRVLRRQVVGRRILWLDPFPKNNALGFRVLTGQGPPIRWLEDEPGAVIHLSRTLEDALGELGAANRVIGDDGYDLVVTHWGHDPNGTSTAERLLRAMRKAEMFSPVVVFASGAFREQNRRRALRLGALAFTDRWSEFFSVVEGVFSDATAYRTD